MELFQHRYRRALPGHVSQSSLVPRAQGHPMVSYCLSVLEIKVNEWETKPFCKRCQPFYEHTLKPHLLRSQFETQLQGDSPLLNLWNLHVALLNNFYFTLGSLEKEAATQQGSRDVMNHKNHSDQQLPPDAEIPQLSQPSQTPLSHPVPPSSAESVLPSTNQQSCQIADPSSAKPTEPPNPSSESNISQSTSCQLSRLSPSQPPRLSPNSPKKIQVDHTTKKVKECDKEQKLDVCENEKHDGLQIPVPRTTQPLIPQTSVNVTVTTAEKPVSSVTETQPPSPFPPSVQPSSPQPLPLKTITVTEATNGIITTAVVQSSQLPPPSTTNATLQASSPPPPPHPASTTITTTIQTAPKDKAEQIKIKKNALVLPSVTKTALPTSGGGKAGSKNNGKLKRRSLIQMPINTRGKQLQPTTKTVNKENRRKSDTVDTKQIQSSPSQMETERQPPQRAPLLIKRNPSLRLVLKPSNTNIKKTIKPEFTNGALAAKEVPMKGVSQIGAVGTLNSVRSIPEVETAKVENVKEKCVLRKPSPQPRRNMSGTLTGSKLPKNTGPSENTKPPQKTLSNHSKRLPSPLKKSEAETVSKLNFPSVSAKAIPVAHSSKKSSTTPKIKATIPVQNSEVLRKKPSLLKTPKPVL